MNRGGASVSRFSFDANRPPYSISLNDSTVFLQPVSQRSAKAMSDSLEFRILKYIVAVAETSNFTRAAERLFLAQPSLSKQIRDLEEEIKFPIFYRGFVK
jgi:hypothetical protein